MPNLRVPSQSGAHRIAAIALYRALLTQCRAVPLESAQREELQNIVRNRFKQARHSHSTQRLKISFEAGYEAIDHLDASVAGNEESTRYVSELLQRAPAKTRLPPPPSHELLKALKRVHAANEAREPAQPKISILDRPRPLEQLSGRRHVPVLFNANHIPVLRIKKPQPLSLSRFIRQRVLQRQNRHDRRWRLSSEKELAKHEDEWDRLVANEVRAIESRRLMQSGAGSSAMSKAHEPTWSSAISTAAREVQQQIDGEREKNGAMAEKMQAIVDKEKELYKAETVDRLKARRQARRQSKEGDSEDTTVERNEVRPESEVHMLSSPG